MKKKFEGLRVLFLGSIFYGYCKKIAVEMRTNGAQVTLLETDTRVKWLEYVERIGLHRFSESKWDKIIIDRIREIESEYDVVLIIKGKHLSSQSLNFLKERYKEARKILYLWDAVANTPNWNELYSFADEIYSFDRKDAIKYNLHLRPLFYTEEDVLSDNYKYALSFVGGFHSNRFEIVKKIKESLQTLGLPYCFVIFINKYHYFFYRYISHRIHREDEDIITTKQIPYNRYIQLSEDSLAILDINHKNQSGLTIRSIEALGLSKKLVTTNEDIMSYEMVDKRQVCLIERDKPVIDKSFFTPLVATNTNKSYFNISSFVEELLSNEVDK